MKSDNETRLVLRVLARIQTHTIAGPIAGDALAEEFGISWRKVASIVEQLRDNGHKIGSSNGNPSGYFVARTPEELHPTITRMRDHAQGETRSVDRRREAEHLQPETDEDEPPHDSDDAHASDQDEAGRDGDDGCAEGTIKALHGRGSAEQGE